MEQKKAPHRKRVSIVHTIAVRERTLLYGGRRIDTPEKAAEFLRTLIQDADKEHLLVCCVDVKSQPLSLEVAAIGTSTACFAGMSEVFRSAILSNAVGIIVFHNHPSGDTTSSKEDIRITERLRTIGEILGISILGHIILGAGESFFGFVESGKWLDLRETDGEKEGGTYGESCAGAA